jgi:hypothetical protein
MARSRLAVASATHGGWDVGAWETERTRKNENNLFSRFERRVQRYITAIREVESSNSADRKNSAPLFF